MIVGAAGLISGGFVGATPGPIVAPTAPPPFVGQTLLVQPQGFLGDKYGAIHLPLAAPPAGGAVTDPLLDVLLAFLKAWLATDGMASAAWASVLPSSTPVNATWPRDPRKGGFNERDLPALYAFRPDTADTDVYQMSDDFRVTEVLLTLLWVFPAAPQEKQWPREPFINGLVKAVDTAIERGRTPSFQVPYDTDPLAPTQGSLFYGAAGVSKIELRKARPVKVVLVMNDAKPRTYAAVEMKIFVQELFEFDLNDPLRFTKGAGLSLTILENAEIVDVG